MKPLRIAMTFSFVAVLLVATPVPALAADRPGADPAAGVEGVDGGSAPLPASFPLPNGFQPEGIAIGPGPFAYFGSRGNGAIYQADLRTGQGRIISAGPGTPSLGLKSDHRGRLFVAGGVGGDARVVDIRSGRVLASYPLAAAGASFVNDVILTRDAAWFTDSRNPVLYRVPIGRHGALPTPDQVTRLPLTGDLVYQAGTNANGIVTTPDGRGLIVVQSNTGRLFRVDPRTGVTTAVDLGTENVLNGDGLLRIGRTLYVVQNRLNTVAVLRLDRGAATARVLTRLTDPLFDIPTTVAVFHGRLYLPNARFGVPSPETAPYSVVSIRRR